MDRLIEAVETVGNQLEVLRQVLDEVREEFQWAVRNGQLVSPPSITHVTSMPRDPCAPDWAERLNRLTPEDLPAAELGPAAPNTSAPAAPPRAGEKPEQGELWQS